ncbi:hypothetical protein [Sandaracinus amylolyticus]|uniref:hypothetical protein n=1 Tax=Sandaracinus amylolyticus TaxID=927083 RepID=UPI001F1919C1|nr:hypothetical protein [Sandaracinus amylolyticus]UJR81885.1 Hypothetical protein I5071_39500 [Sandaracinus amylolyticus]
MIIAKILAGDPGSVSELERADPDAWRALIEHLIEHRPAAAPRELVDALLEVDPDFEAWMRRVSDATEEVRSTWFASTTTALRAVRPWLAAGVLATRGPSHPASLKVRYESCLRSADDDALASVVALVADLRAIDAEPALLIDALDLVVRRALEDGLPDDALAAATEAESIARRVSDEQRAAIAGRSRGRALLAAGKVEEGLDVLQTFLRTRGPRFGGGGTFRGSPIPDDPREEAIAEAVTIASWAMATTPEWVGALGGIAERSSDAQGAASLWSRFDAALGAMVAAAEDPFSELEVVVRQATERTTMRTATAAAERLHAELPDDLEAASVVGRLFVRVGRFEDAWRVFARAAQGAPADEPSRSPAFLGAARAAVRAGAIDDAERLLAEARRDAVDLDEPRAELCAIEIALARGAPDALDRAWRLFEQRRARPRDLVESATGFGIADALANALLASRDRRAIDVQRAVWDAKLALWGECPAAWLEEHNLGTIHVELGDAGAARPLIESAARKLERQLGGDHPHAAMARRSLARLDATA